MKRRKLLLGIGTMAGAGGVAGSGAFTSVAADRGVDVAVADDTDAFLRIGPCTDDDGNALPNGEYVDDDDGELTLDLTDDNPTSGGGTGINAEATTVLDNVFEIANQGTQPVGVWLNVDPAVAGNGKPAIEFYRGDDQGTGIVGQDNATCLGVGESICVGLVIRTYGISDGDELFATYPGKDGEAMIVNADVDVACSSGGGGGTFYNRVWATDVDHDETTLGNKNNGDPIDDDRDDPEDATGDADGDFVSLGFGGELVLEFTGSSGPIVPNPNAPDIVIEEVTGGRPSYPEEKVTIEAEVLSPGSGWQSLGMASSRSTNGRTAFDFGGNVDEVEAIRIVDQTDPEESKNNADGYDVAAVGGWTESQPGT